MHRIEEFWAMIFICAVIYLMIIIGIIGEASSWESQSQFAKCELKS